MNGYGEDIPGWVFGLGVVFTIAIYALFGFVMARSNRQKRRW